MMMVLVVRIMSVYFVRVQNSFVTHIWSLL